MSHICFIVLIMNSFCSFLLRTHTGTHTHTATVSLRCVCVRACVCACVRVYMRVFCPFDLSRFPLSPIIMGTIDPCWAIPYCIGTGLWWLRTPLHSTLLTSTLNAGYLYKSANELNVFSRRLETRDYSSAWSEVLGSMTVGDEGRIQLSETEVGSISQRLNRPGRPQALAAPVRSCWSHSLRSSPRSGAPSSCSHSTNT